MIRFGKKAAVFTAAGMLAVSALTGCSGSIDTDAVVATVGEEEITLGVANFYARLMQGEYETYYAPMVGFSADTMWTQEEDGSTYEETTKESIMTNLQNMYLIAQHAEEYSISLTEEEQDAITAVAEQFDADNSDEVKEVVSGYQKNIETFLELMTIQTKMNTAMREGVDEEVSDEEAAQKSMQYLYFSYTSSGEDGTTTELTDEEKETLKTTAQGIGDRLKNGEDINTLAEEAGVEVQTTTFDSETSIPNSDLIAAADALENEGDVTELVETDSGIYVAKLTSLLDREATDAEKETIIEQRRQEQYDSLLEQWRDAVEIKVNERVWKKVRFADQGITAVTPEDDTAEDGNNTTDTSDSESDTDNTSDSGNDAAE